MVLPATPLSQWTEADLQRLVDVGAQENEVLEFKAGMYGPGDRDKREMLKDVTSMANQKGGHLIIGMQTDKNGVATELVGVEGTGHVERVRSSCLVNIDRHIVGLDVEDVALANGNIAIVVRVPPSLNAPHMVTFEGRNQFWIRHGRQKAPMTVDEMQQALERGMESESLTERYMANRRERLLSLTKDQTWLLLMATPVPPRQEVVDVHDQNLKHVLTEPRQHPVCGSILFGFRLTGCLPTLQGLRAGGLPADRQALGLLQQVGIIEENGLPAAAEAVDFLELHRNGHLEVATMAPWRQPGKRSIPSQWIACYIDDFVELARKVWQQIGVVRPLVTKVIVLNAVGLWLHLTTDAFQDMKGKPFVESAHLELPDEYITDITVESDRRQIVKRLNDRLWNAFGLEKCAFFDDQGAWV